MNAAERWKAVDEYSSRLFELEDDVLEAALRSSREHGLPEIQVSYAQGQMLHLLARAMNARRILEIGTLGGFSTIFLARALPEDGVLYTLELEPVHAQVARESLARAGMDKSTHVVVGDARDSLRTMIDEHAEPFDLVFLDADKTGYTAYTKSVLELSHPGTMIVADNIVRDGEVIDARSGDPMVLGVREFNAYVASHPRLRATIIQTVGTKGYDGFAVVVVGP